MSTTSKFTVGNTEYDLRDADAQEQLTQLKSDFDELDETIDMFGYSAKYNYFKNDIVNTAGSARFTVTPYEAEQELPFFPLPYFKYTLTQDTTSLSPIMFTLPAELLNTNVTIDFWLKSITNMQYRLWYGIDGTTTYFDNLPETSFQIGKKWTKTTATMEIDARIGDWWHFKVTIPQTGISNTNIYIGTSIGSNGGYYYFSKLRAVKGDSEWFINYPSTSESGKKNILNITSVPEVQVFCNDIRYEIRHLTDNAKYLDCWRIYQAHMINNDVLYLIWQSSDADGVVRIKNESDYIGGFHGYEHTESIKMFVDGVETSISQMKLNFRVLDIFVVSTLYHHGTQNACCTRYKHIRFDDNGLTISNVWKALEQIVIITAFTGMLSVEDEVRGSTFDNGYTTNTSNEIKSYNADTAYNEDLKAVTYFTPVGTLTIETYNTQENNYGGQVMYYSDGSRSKTYMNSALSEVTLQTGDTIKGGYKLKRT